MEAQSCGVVSSEGLPVGEGARVESRLVTAIGPWPREEEAGPASVMSRQCRVRACARSIRDLAAIYHVPSDRDGVT